MNVRQQVVGEFFGTGLMVAVGCGSVALGASHGLVSLTFGGVVLFAILLFGPLSGAHINPAVTIAFWRDGQLSSRLVPVYILSQLSGATVGAYLVNSAAPTTLASSVSLFEGFLVEVLITMLLMTSILFVVQRSQRRLVVAVWVGATVAALALIAGPWTGASMNPARTFGPNLLSGLWFTLPFYFTSTVLGAWFACDVKQRWFPERVVAQG
jgi:glycerol uptake facilitator-like aquaporin